MARASPNVSKERSSASGAFSDNHTKLLHTQDLMDTIRDTAIKMKGERDRGKTRRAICKKAGIRDPFLRALVLAILRGDKGGGIYKIKGDPMVRDADCWWIGHQGQRVAKAAHNLRMPNLYTVECQKCHKQIPVLVVRVELPKEREWYERKTGEEVLEETHLYLTIECGQIRLTEPGGREITSDMLLR